MICIKAFLSIQYYVAQFKVLGVCPFLEKVFDIDGLGSHHSALQHQTYWTLIMPFLFNTYHHTHALNVTKQSSVIQRCWSSITELLLKSRLLINHIMSAMSRLGRLVTIVKCCEKKKKQLKND